MTKQRLLATALLFQLLALVLLVQTWFTLSMVIEDRPLELGAFDGSSAFPVSMPFALLALSALLVALISNGFALASALSLTSLSNLANLALVLPLIAAQDLSALASQLDRLTGIANTHGLDDLGVDQSLLPFAWIAVTLVSALIPAISLKHVGKWQSARFDRVGTANKSKRTPAVSTIDLWDNQRD